MQYLGEIAAIGTSVSWAANSLFCTEGSHRIGSFAMNHYRMLFAVVLIATAFSVINGRAFPWEMATQDVLLLAVSGFLGYFICDAFLFQCYVDLSPRVGVLAFSFYPFASALMAWLFIGEKLSLLAWLGMIVTFSGIVFVLAERSSEGVLASHRHFRRGLLFAAGAVFFQGASLVIAKPVMSGPNDIDPLAATLIRALAGFAGFWLVTLFRGHVGIVLGKISDLKAMSLIGVGSVIGPFMGVWLSMVAIKNAPVGIAAVLMSLMPIMILPMSALVYKEKISWRAIFGAIVSFVGVTLLFKS